MTPINWVVVVGIIVWGVGAIVVCCGCLNDILKEGITKNEDKR